MQYAAQQHFSNMHYFYGTDVPPRSFSSVTFPALNRRTQLLMAIAVSSVVVDHSCCLHIGITDCRANKTKTALFEIFAHGI